MAVVVGNGGGRLSRSHSRVRGLLLSGVSLREILSALAIVTPVVASVCSVITAANGSSS